MIVDKDSCVGQSHKIENYTSNKTKYSAYTCLKPFSK